MIRFNKPYLFGDELVNVNKAVEKGRLAGNGDFTKLCHSFFETQMGFSKALLTTSCTDALEMTSILLDIQPGDEVIVPAFTFVSSANAFALRGAKIVFADSHSTHPNIDETKLESLITDRTKAIILVHYGGVACEMDEIMSIAARRNVKVVEDAAQAVESFYKGRRLGTIGDLGVLSFHETKNVVSGEGGLLIVNRPEYEKRSEIIWEKGTNRASFFRGEVDKYGWVDLGSSYLPSELIAAYLYGQLVHLKDIQDGRVSIWQQYHDLLMPGEERGFYSRPFIPDYASNNGHVYYLLCRSLEERSSLIGFLKEHEVSAVFHYLSLHSSPYFKDNHKGLPLPNSDMFSDRLVRLPLHLHLTVEDVNRICKLIDEFYEMIEE